ncbi:pseudouridine synthase [Streptomyces sp. BI20]|uniref:pseudouridine synthase n=1 Tax=Streptomyces sp. BI20 TaxID=3403460 RepID=UPI003C736C6D
MSSSIRRRRRAAVPPAPLPQRLGIDPVHLRLPEPDPAEPAPATVGEWLRRRYAHGAGAAAVVRLLAEGAIVDADGRPVAAGDPYRAGAHLWFHRELPPEVPVPFEIPVLHRDERLLVVDKPHFLAGTPRGGHVVQTALARLRHTLDLPELAPAHRLDRLTAGVLMFTVRPEDRGAYQGLFRDRRIHKTYEAVAPYDPARAAELPVTVRSHIEKTPGVIAAVELPDAEPNAESLVELVEARPETGLARYRLTPHTGRTHQLRVHMNRLGLPILGDPIYPEVTDPDPDDFRRPLQLLARSLEFTDPRTGERHVFRSARTLRAWTDPTGWALDQRTGPAPELSPGP